MCAMNDGGNPPPLSPLLALLRVVGGWFKGLSPPWQPKNDFQVGPLIMKSKSKPKILSGEFAQRNEKRAN